MSWLHLICHDERETLLNFLATHHHVFSLEEGERGETDIIQMEIDTGSAYPKRQAPRRMPFAEVARQLSEIQRTGVIEPSKSPWASPVVLVRKRDGTHRSVLIIESLTRSPSQIAFLFPHFTSCWTSWASQGISPLSISPRDFGCVLQHKRRLHFSPIKVSIYEFHVMPFGLANIPSVFQRLMQQVISPLNTASGPNFVSVYLDDILVFSRTLEEHLRHLQVVFGRLVEVGLKLKPAKCKFAHKELEYLGHIVSRDGLKTNPHLIAAVREFPTPQTVHDVRRFLGLASYYRRFVPNFARIACPLHRLTCKGAEFMWSPEQEGEFTELKTKLTTMPVLVYPDFDNDFALETDASVQGIGAVLSHYQKERRLHPIGYASRALNPVWYYRAGDTCSSLTTTYGN